jgi:uracil-DNA glycosylase
VEEGKPGSHSGKGWEEFTDFVIKKISEEKENVIFMLWGNFAFGKIPLINPQKHIILKAPHPSPLSAHRGFIGCGHFGKANQILKERGELEIIWL